MGKFKHYFEAFSAATDWSEVQAAFDDAFHADLRVVTPDGELNKEQWEEAAKGLLARAPRRPASRSPRKKETRPTTA